MQKHENAQQIGHELVEEQLFLAAYGWQQNEVVEYRFARRHDKSGKKKVGLYQPGPIKALIDRIVIYSDGGGSDNLPVLVLDVIDGKLEWQDNKSLRISGKIRAYATSSGHILLDLQYAANGKCTKWTFALEGEKNAVPVLGNVYKRIVDALAGFSGASDERFVKLTTGNELSASFLERFHIGRFKQLGAGHCYTPDLRVHFQELRQASFLTPSDTRPRYIFVCEMKLDPHLEGHAQDDCDSIRKPVDDLPLYLEERPSSAGSPLRPRVPVTPNTGGDIPFWLIRQSQPTAWISTGAKPSKTDLRTTIWNVRLTGVPASVVPPIVNEYEPDYRHAVRTVGAGRPISFFPRLDEEIPTGTYPWMTVWNVEDNSGGDVGDIQVYPNHGRVTVHPLSLQPARPDQPGPATETNGLTGQFPLCESVEGIPLTVSFDAHKLDDREVEELRGLVLNCARPVSATVLSTVRMGSLALTFEPYPPGGAAQETSRWSMRYQKGLVSIQADANLYLTQILPGGQDDLPGEEFVPANARLFSTSCTPLNAIDPTDSQQVDREIESLFGRVRPLVIRRGGSSRGGSFLFRAMEQNSADLSRTVRFTISTIDLAGPKALKAIRLKGSSSARPSREQVIILDTEPFLIAQVDFASFTQTTQQSGNIVATWSGDVDGATWQILAAGEDAKNFTLNLPPAALGEEMVRDDTFTGDRPADFRLSPLSELSLAGSYFPQAYIEPPWNLRRNLGFAGQRDAGAAIKYMQYELLYGMSCRAEAPFIRLAEVFSLAGAIPGRMPPEIRWQTFSTDQQIAYANKRLEWAELYHRYLSRLALLQPWDSHVEGSLTLSKSVGCRIRIPSDIRPPANTNFPGNLADADLADPINPTDKLRGGVTWGFESKNVYTAVTANPYSTSAAISDLAFSSLGAWGLQQAGFDKDRTTIYNNAAMGRTYYYKLERIGRIAVWWNKAKHVIVYERTVVPSRQFTAEQKKLEGLPLLRKVEEYIEILDEERRYPDDAGLKQSTASGSAEALRAAQVRRGFVTSCRFPKNTKIAVESSWGSDVGDMGWKVPLWRPGAQPPDVYPKPRISAGLISQFGDGSGEVPCDFSEPQNFYFYTDTRKDTSGNPDDWEPILGVDYVDRPQPQPTPDFSGGNTAQTSASDVGVPPGFDVCTFALEPPSRPIDVGATRIAQPMAVKLDAVTVARCKFNPSGVFPGAAQDLVQLSGYVRDGWTELMRVATQPVPDVQAILKAVSDSFNNGQFKKFAAAYSSIRQLIGDTSTTSETILTTIKKQLEVVDTQALDSLHNQLQYATKYKPPDIGTGIEQLLNGDRGIGKELQRISGIADKTEQIRQLRQLVTESMAAVEERIRELRASPGQLSATVRLYTDAVTHILTELTTLAATITQGLGSPTTAVGDARWRIASQLRSTASRFGAIWANTQVRTLQPWLPNPASSVLAAMPGLDDEIKRRVAILNSTANDLENSASYTVGQLQQQLNAASTALPAAIDKALTAVMASADDKLYDLKNGVLVSLISSLATQRTQFLKFADATNITALQSGFTDLLSTTSSAATNVYQVIAGLTDQIKQQRDALFKFVQGELTAPFKALDDLTEQNLKAAIQAASGALAALQQLRDSQFEAAQNYYRKFFDTLLPTTTDVAAAKNGGLALVRAFGDPPQVPELTFDREKIAYYFDELSDRIGVTPVLGHAKELGAAISELSPVNITLPTLSLGDRLIPPSLEDFNLSSIFPKIAGLDLSNLFSGVHLPDAGDGVKVSHGVDPQSRAAWLQIDVNTAITKEPVSIFDAGLLSVKLAEGNLTARARLDARLNQPPSRAATGKVSGNWVIQLSGFELVQFVQTELQFDNSGHIQFSIKPENVKLNGVLAFVSDFLATFNGKDSGLSVRLTDTGIESLLSLPIPDFQGAVFGIANLRLAASFGVDITNGFTLTTGFSLARREAPFTLTIFILGGSGYLESSTSYTPGGSLKCRVDMAIMASASLAIALGPISGGVYVYFGITANFSFASGASGQFRVGVLFIIRGQVNLLGIVSAGIALMLEATYDTSTGQLTGTGQLSVSIKICWCFTLEVHQSVTYHVGGGAERAASVARESYPILAALEDWQGGTAGGGAGVTLPACDNRFISDYLAMLA